MPETVADAIAEFYERYPDAKKAADARALRLINRVDADICSEMGLRMRDYRLELTAGIQSYALADMMSESIDGTNIVRIYGAELRRSTRDDDQKPLKETNPRAMDIKWPNHRSVPAGEPGYYFVNGPQIGVFPRPDTTTATTGPEDGYPFILVHASCKEVMEADSDLPEAILTNEVYLAGMCWYYALVNDRGAADGWGKLYNFEKKRLQRYLNGFIEPDNQEIIALHVPRMRPV